ncbi:MAG: hypothetical protein Q8R13_01855, partial [bacterium]|nr:hypothetical protein [bacterium]
MQEKTQSFPVPNAVRDERSEPTKKGAEGDRLRMQEKTQSFPVPNAVRDERSEPTKEFRQNECFGGRTPRLRSNRAGEQTTEDAGKDAVFSCPEHSEGSRAETGRFGTGSRREALADGGARREPRAKVQENRRFSWGRRPTKRRRLLAGEPRRGERGATEEGG